MRRIRLSTLMLLVVIAALVVALVVQDRRVSRLEAELQVLRRGDVSASIQIVQAELRSSLRKKRQPGNVKPTPANP